MWQQWNCSIKGTVPTYQNPPWFVQGIQNIGDGVEEGDIIFLGTDISESQFHLIWKAGLWKSLYQVTISSRDSFPTCLGRDCWKEGNEVKGRMQKSRARPKVVYKYIGVRSGFQDQFSQLWSTSMLNLTPYCYEKQEFILRIKGGWWIYIPGVICHTLKITLLRLKLSFTIDVLTLWS